MTKHSKFEREKRTAETERVKQIEAAWFGSMSAEASMSSITSSSATTLPNRRLTRSMDTSGVTRPTRPGR